MNDPFESYKLYNALKLHFESSYDAIKYNFKTSIKPQSFFKRKDKYFFAKLASTYGTDLKDFYIAILVFNADIELRINCELFLDIFCNIFLLCSNLLFVSKYHH